MANRAERLGARDTICQAKLPITIATSLSGSMHRATWDADTWVCGRPVHALLYNCIKAHEYLPHSSVLPRLATIL